MNRRILVEATINNELAFEFAIQIGLIKPLPTICCLCNGKLNKEKGKIRHGVDLRLRCNQRACRATFSPYKNSIFEIGKLNINQVFDLIYSYCERKTTKEAAVESQIERKAVAVYYAKFREIITFSNMRLERLGGDDDIVEVDETHIYSFKNNQGRILAGQKYWIIGLFSRNTQKIKLQVTRRRTKEVCHRFISENVRTNTCIFTDMWRGYIGLDAIGFRHSFVNHKVEFVNSNDRNIHTNHIERLWRSLKEKLAKSFKLSAVIKAVKEFEILYNEKAFSVNERYEKLIESIKNYF